MWDSQASGLWRCSVFILYGSIRTWKFVRFTITRLRVSTSPIQVKNTRTTQASSRAFFSETLKSQKLENPRNREHHIDLWKTKVGTAYNLRFVFRSLRSLQPSAQRRCRRHKPLTVNCSARPMAREIPIDQSMANPERTGHHDVLGVIQEFGFEVTQLGRIELLHKRHGNRLYRVVLREDNYILKVFGDDDAAREVRGYRLLQNLGVPTLQTAP
jgi:hypothetical protein